MAVVHPEQAKGSSIASRRPWWLQEHSDTHVASAHQDRKPFIRNKVRPYQRRSTVGLQRFSTEHPTPFRHISRDLTASYLNYLFIDF